MWRTQILSQEQIAKQFVEQGLSGEVARRLAAEVQQSVSQDLDREPEKVSEMGGPPHFVTINYEKSNYTVQVTREMNPTVYPDGH